MFLKKVYVIKNGTTETLLKYPAIAIVLACLLKVNVPVQRSFYTKVGKKISVINNFENLYIYTSLFNLTSVHQTYS